MESLVASCVNLAILIGFLVVKLRVPMRDFVSNRHHSIAKEVEAVQVLLANAQRQYDEFTAKLKAIDGEIVTLREQMKKDAAEMNQRVVSEAQRLSAVLLSDAKATSDGLFSELKGQLYRDLSAHVLTRAEEVLQERLTGDDRVRIRQEFSRQVESVQ